MDSALPETANGTLPLSTDHWHLAPQNSFFAKTNHDENR
jgi:hypothetical protein